MSELPPSWNALGAAQEAPMMVVEAMSEAAFEREVSLSAAMFASPACWPKPALARLKSLV